MKLTGSKIKGGHARIRPAVDLLEERRAIYYSVIELLASVNVAAVISDDVVDNPVVRGHIGAVLQGSATFATERLRSIEELVTRGTAVDVAGQYVRIASAAIACERLAEVLHRVEQELGSHGADHPGLRVLLAADDRFAAAASQVIGGARLAVDLMPDLVADLLPHIALFVVLASDSAGRLGSASAREFPGLVLLPEPGSALEVAEAILHEGAHQKFFDLSATCRIFGPDQPGSIRFEPPWAEAGAPPWPLEQVFAAFHAYCCLDALAVAVATRPDLVLHEDSLLPFARVRAAAIGEWLLKQGSFLGEDGHLLIEILAGRRPYDGPASSTETLGAEVAEDVSTVVKSVGGRTLVVRASRPVELFWTLSTCTSAR